MASFEELKSLSSAPGAVCTTTGCTGVEVYFIPHLNAYLKVGAIGKVSDLFREMEMLAWLNGRAQVPHFIDYASDSQREALLISAIEGRPLSEILAEGSNCLVSETLIEKAAAALSTLHRIQIEECPFGTRLDWRFARAKRNAELHLLSETDEEFGAEHDGKLPLEILSELDGRRPVTEDLVFTHGDPSLPNIIFDNGEFNGFIDLDGAGVADRYVDISIFLRSVRYNARGKTEFIEAFCRGYGIASLDPNLIEFYTLIDDLF